MVDFSKPINDADMIGRLNDLIHHNMSLLVNLDEDLPHLEKESHLARMWELKKMHRHHVRILSDTVRELGGAPDYSEDGRFYWLGKGKMWLGKWQGEGWVLQAVAREEEKLRAHYQSALQALKASSESVVAIRQAMEEHNVQLSSVNNCVT